MYFKNLRLRIKYNNIHRLFLKLFSLVVLEDESIQPLIGSIDFNLFFIMFSSRAKSQTQPILF